MLPNVRRILYCTDLSDNANHAFRYAVYLAKLTGAEVHVLHVVGKLSNDAVVVLQAYLDNADSPKKISQNRIAKAKQELTTRQDEFWQTLPEADRAVRKQVVGVHVSESYPAETILQKVAELGCDLIVMGSHERGIVHTFLGSVAKSVLRRSRVPTLIAPPPEEGGQS